MIKGEICLVEIKDWFLGFCFSGWLVFTALDQSTYHKVWSFNLHYFYWIEFDAWSWFIHSGSWRRFFSSCYIRKLISFCVFTTQPSVALNSKLMWKEHSLLWIILDYVLFVCIECFTLEPVSCLILAINFWGEMSWNLICLEHGLPSLYRKSWKWRSLARVLLKSLSSVSVNPCVLR